MHNCHNVISVIMSDHVMPLFMKISQPFSVYKSPCISWKQTPTVCLYLTTPSSTSTYLIMESSINSAVFLLMSNVKELADSLAPHLPLYTLGARGDCIFPTKSSKDCPY